MKESMYDELKRSIKDIRDMVGKAEPEEIIDWFEQHTEKWTALGEVNQEYESLNYWSKLTLFSFIVATFLAICAVVAPETPVIATYRLIDVVFWALAAGIFAVAVFLWKYHGFNVRVSRIELGISEEEAEE